MDIVRKRKMLLQSKKTLLSLGLSVNFVLQTMNTDKLSLIESETAVVKMGETTSSSPNYEVHTLKYEVPYYAIPVDKEYQDYLRYLGKKYDIPESISFTIGDVESGGHWNTNGKISPTNDYGQFQINIKNLPLLEEIFGYTKEEILNDPYKNAECAHYLLKIIFDKYKYTKEEYDFENVCGTYNGWTKWQENEDANEYVLRCQTAYEQKFKNKEAKYDYEFEFLKH